MKPYQRQFIEFALNKQAFQFGDFILKSGRRSPYFFNAGVFNSGRDLSLLGRFHAAALMDSTIDFDLLFGPAYKGIPIAITTAIALSEHYGREVYYCFNRKEVKDHGEGGKVVGRNLKGNIILIDDVITAGTAIREAIEIIKIHGAKLAGILISLDRQERRNGNSTSLQEVEQEYNCKVHSIIRMQDIIFYLKDRNKTEDHLFAVRAYLEKFGV